MKNERLIDPELKLEAKKLRQRLLQSSPTASPSKKASSLYELWLGDLTSLAGKVTPGTVPGLP
jgi:hypothetical protein